MSVECGCDWNVSESHSEMTCQKQSKKIFHNIHKNNYNHNTVFGTPAIWSENILKNFQNIASIQENIFSIHISLPLSHLFFLSSLSLSVAFSSRSFFITNDQRYFSSGTGQ